MQTIQEIRRGIEADISDLDRQIESDKREIRAMLNDAEARGLNTLPADADMRAEQLMRNAERAEAARRRKADALSRAIQVENEENESEKRLNTVHNRVTPRANRTATLSVTRNDRTYNQSSDPNGRNFLLDVARSAVFNDRSANARLDRHMDEERVERPQYSERAAGDLITGGLGGLVVPQYLVDLYAPAIANMRPLANVVNHHPLPQSGMTFTVPKITTATSAAIQATQLTAVSATTLVETDLNLTVQTAAGSQNISRQAVERGTGIDDITAADLFKRVATVVDSTLINAATVGISASAQVITYTDASPTPALMYPFIFQAESKLEQALLAQARVDYVVMHPRRWNWLCAGVGSTFPFLQNVDFPGGPQTTAVQVTNQYGASVRGVLSNGLKVVVDANVPTNGGLGTNQDEIYVVASQEVHLWEDPNAPILIRAEQPNAAQLGILLVCYSYFASTNQRYASNPSAIKGTGLVAPAGF
jgi:hypothetical protein